MGEGDCGDEQRKKRWRSMYEELTKVGGKEDRKRVVTANLESISVLES